MATAQYVGVPSSGYGHFATAHTATDDSIEHEPAGYRYKNSHAAVTSSTQTPRGAARPQAAPAGGQPYPTGNAWAQPTPVPPAGVVASSGFPAGYAAGAYPSRAQGSAVPIAQPVAAWTTPPVVAQAPSYGGAYVYPPLFPYGLAPEQLVALAQAQAVANAAAAVPKQSSDATGSGRTKKSKRGGKKAKRATFAPCSGHPSSDSSSGAGGSSSNTSSHNKARAASKARRKPATASARSGSSAKKQAAASKRGAGDGSKPSNVAAKTSEETRAAIRRDRAAGIARRRPARYVRRHVDG